jgi:hypothetical protein
VPADKDLTIGCRTALGNVLATQTDCDLFRGARKALRESRLTET